MIGTWGEAGKICWANDKHNGGEHGRLGDMRYPNKGLQKRGEAEDGTSNPEVTMRSEKIEDALGK